MILFESNNRDVLSTISDLVSLLGWVIGGAFGVKWLLMFRNDQHDTNSKFSKKTERKTGFNMLGRPWTSESEETVGSVDEVTSSNKVISLGNISDGSKQND